MTRSWIGFGLLLALLALSLAATAAMTRIHEEISLDLDQASQCALEKDWDNADLFLNKARTNWDKWEHFRACFSDHAPAEEIDAAFSALEVYSRTRERISFAAGCASLADQTSAIGDAHRPVWWNFF